jgi:hypothetical protein
VPGGRTLTGRRRNSDVDQRDNGTFGYPATTLVDVMARSTCSNSPALRFPGGWELPVKPGRGVRPSTDTGLRRFRDALKIPSDEQRSYRTERPLGRRVVLRRALERFPNCDRNNDRDDEQSSDEEGEDEPGLPRGEPGGLLSEDPDRDDYTRDKE